VAVPGFQRCLDDLTDKVVALLELGIPTIRSTCKRVGGRSREWRWILEKEGTDLRIRIFRFAETFSRLEDEEAR